MVNTTTISCLQIQSLGPCPSYRLLRRKALAQSHMPLRLHEIHPYVWIPGALSNAITIYKVRVVGRHKPSSKKCLFSKQNAKAQQLQT